MEGVAGGGVVAGERGPAADGFIDIDLAGFFARDDLVTEPLDDLHARERGGEDGDGHGFAQILRLKLQD